MYKYQFKQKKKKNKNSRKFLMYVFSLRNFLNILRQYLLLPILFVGKEQDRAHMQHE